MPAPHSLIPLRISATSGTEIVLIQTLSSDTLNRILEYVDNTTRLDRLLTLEISGVPGRSISEVQASEPDNDPIPKRGSP